jgi:hypothetical protein
VNLTVAPVRGFQLAAGLAPGTCLRQGPVRAARRLSKRLAAEARMMEYRHAEPGDAEAIALHHTRSWRV